MNKTILVTGGSGMVGTALKQIQHKYSQYNFFFFGSRECDLLDRKAVFNLFKALRPELVIHLAAKVGGLRANMENMADFYSENILINTNVIDACKEYKVEKVVSLLSTCIYPDSVSYPLVEEDIHAGVPHGSNFAYAYTKRMLDVQSRAYRKQYGCNFITVVPNNLFGENDNFDLENSHVIPAIIRKVYEAKINKKSVEVWGDGSPLREFTYSRDVAHSLIYVLENYNDASPLNIGNTSEISIKKVVKKICKIIEYSGRIKWIKDAPMGQHRKPSDNSKFIKLGWESERYTNMDKALKNTIKWFLDNYPKNTRGVEYCE